MDHWLVQPAYSAPFAAQENAPGSDLKIGNHSS